MWEWNDGTYLAHHGIKGQRWGIRRYQNSDGTLTAEGRNRMVKTRHFLNENRTENATVAGAAGAATGLALKKVSKSIVDRAVAKNTIGNVGQRFVRTAGAATKGLATSLGKRAPYSIPMRVKGTAAKYALSASRGVTKRVGGTAAKYALSATGGATKISAITKISSLVGSKVVPLAQAYLVNSTALTIAMTAIPAAAVVAGSAYAAYAISKKLRNDIKLREEYADEALDQYRYSIDEKKRE